MHPRSGPRIVPRPARALARAASLVLALVGIAVGCSRSRELPEEHFGRGVLLGRVRLAAGTELPEYASADLQRRPMHPDDGGAPAECAAANERARHPVQQTADGLLSGIVVAASDFTGAVIGKPPKPAHHRVVVRGCRLEPPVIAARGGDWLEIENADDFAFSPLIGPSVRRVPLEKGRLVRLPIAPARVDSLMCTPRAPCGRTDIVSFRHPVFAVSDATGHFRIPSFPDSQLVRVTAWHPLFEASENFVWVEPGQSATIELVMVPKPRFVPTGHTASTH